MVEEEEEEEEQMKSVKMAAPEVEGGYIGHRIEAVAAELRGRVIVAEPVGLAVVCFSSVFVPMCPLVAEEAVRVRQALTHRII
jgi:hypothetical protein